MTNLLEVCEILVFMYMSNLFLNINRFNHLGVISAGSHLSIKQEVKKKTSGLLNKASKVNLC